MADNDYFELGLNEEIVELVESPDPTIRTDLEEVEFVESPDRTIRSDLEEDVGSGTMDLEECGQNTGLEQGEVYIEGQLMERNYEPDKCILCKNPTEEHMCEVIQSLHFTGVK